VYRQFTKVAAGRLIQPGGSQVRDIWFRATTGLCCKPG